MPVPIPPNSPRRFVPVPIPPIPLSGRRSVAYGYLWWIHRPDPEGGGQRDIYAAQGFRGQYIFVVPEHEMVVVVTAGTSRYSDEVRPIDLLYREILPSVKRSEY